MIPSTSLMTRLLILVAHDAHRADVGQYSEVLPDLAVLVPRTDLLAYDGIGGAKQLELLARDVADDAHGQTRAWERLPMHDLVGQAEFAEVEVHTLGEWDEVVVALDLGRRLVARLDDVGVQRALREEANAVKRRGLLEEDVPELLADDPALEFRVGHAGKQREVAVLGVDVNEIDAEGVAERVDNLVGLVEA